MSAPRCPKCGNRLAPVEALLECRRCQDGRYYEPTANGRLRPAPSPYPEMSPEDPAEEALTDTVAERWTPDMARSSIRGAVPPVPMSHQQRLDAAGAVDLCDNLRLVHLRGGYVRAEPVDPTKRHGPSDAAPSPKEQT